MSQPLEIQRLFLVFYAAQKTAAVKAKVKLSDQFGTVLFYVIYVVVKEAPVLLLLLCSIF